MRSHGGSGQTRAATSYECRLCRARQNRKLKKGPFFSFWDRAMICIPRKYFERRECAARAQNHPFNLRAPLAIASAIVPVLNENIGEARTRVLNFLTNSDVFGKGSDVNSIYSRARAVERP
jgi:hypothetical protein